MNETKFTKGDWVADYGTVSCGNISIADCELNSMEYTATEIANARLIAAAPEMYDELLSARDMLNAIWHDNGSYGVKNKADDISKLLAKARGE